MATPSISQARPERPRAASFGKLIFTQTRIELLMALRQGERILVTLFIPILLLIFFSALKILPAGDNESIVAFLLPGVLALAIIASGMVSLGIATAYERYYGVLKRLGTSPLPRSGLIIAKVFAVLMLELIQIILLVAVAIIFYGWQLSGSLPLALLALVLGTVTFSALGLAMAGRLRAEATLAGANALYLIFLLISGGILPLDHLPAPLAAFAQILPPAALTQALQNTMIAGKPFPGSALAILAIWAGIILIVAIKTFRWE
ncbi:MAG TPA: ABC transporter permease [Ktedonobacteraceae bacterium]|nr:ABC transporter permease [Ktedonobacteraceae bacterium]